MYGRSHWLPEGLGVGNRYPPSEKISSGALRRRKTQRQESGRYV